MEMVRQQGDMLNAMRNEKKNESPGSTETTKSEPERGTLGKAVEAASWVRIIHLSLFPYRFLLILKDIQLDE
jgi:hypothetical protein